MGLKLAMNCSSSTSTLHCQPGTRMGEAAVRREMPPRVPSTRHESWRTLPLPVCLWDLGSALSWTHVQQLSFSPGHRPSCETRSRFNSVLGSDTPGGLLLAWLALMSQGTAGTACLCVLPGSRPVHGATRATDLLQGSCGPLTQAPWSPEPSPGVLTPQREEAAANGQMRNERRLKARLHAQCLGVHSR